MESLLTILITGFILRGEWIMVREIRRDEEKSRNDLRLELDYWRLGGGEDRRNGYDTIDTSECSNWDWLELPDVG